MGWIIFWTIVIVHWAVAFKRLPVYYKRWYAHDQEHWGTIHSKKASQKSAAWTSIGLMFVWPYYEGGRWVRDTIILSMTKEERRQAEYEKAAKIVSEYQERKDREEREAFDLALRGEK